MSTRPTYHDPLHAAERSLISKLFTGKYVLAFALVCYGGCQVKNNLASLQDDPAKACADIGFGRSNPENRPTQGGFWYGVKRFANAPYCTTKMAADQVKSQ
jgi:hypothetical protein